MYRFTNKQGWLVAVCLMLMLVIVAGCGSNNDKGTAEPKQSESNQSATNAETDKKDSAEQDAKEEKTAGETKLIKHQLGETPIEQTPQRVVVLDWSLAEHVLALGMQPVGITDIVNMKKWVNVPLEIGADVVDIGDRSAPDLELTASLKPDLILGLTYNSEANYDMLSAIAPTIVFDAYPVEGAGTQYDRMIETFETIAHVLDREGEAEAELANLEAVYKAAREKIAASSFNGKPIVLAMGYSQQNAAVLRISTDNALAIAILEKLGLSNAHKPAGFEVYGFTTSDIEALPSLQDANFLHMIQADDNIIENILKDNEVWKNLNFVKEDRVYALGGDTWPYGGTLAAKVMAEKTAEILSR